MYVGCVGARFEKPGYMEWQHMVVTESQNSEANGYGYLQYETPTSMNAYLLRTWADFYKIPYFPTFEDVTALEQYMPREFKEQYIRLSSTQYFNRGLYLRRMELVIKPFLLDANERGRMASEERGNLTTVFCVVVGLGLGVWKLYRNQDQLLADVYASLLSEINLPYISDISFNNFPAETHCGGCLNNEIFRGSKNNHIRIRFSFSNPLCPVGEGKLLVAQYAWDSSRYYVCFYNAGREIISLI